MKKYFYLLIIISFTFYLTGCTPIVAVKSESQPAPKMEQLDQYQKIYIGWLDFGRDNWEKFQYESMAKWQEEIKDFNLNSFQVYLKENLQSKKFIFAKSETSKPEGDLAILFTNTEIESFQQTYLNTEIHFIDLSKNNEIYKTSIKAFVRRPITKTVGFTNTFPYRVYFALHNTADYIISKFQKPSTSTSSN